MQKYTFPIDFATFFRLTILTNFNFTQIYTKKLKSRSDELIYIAEIINIAKQCPKKICSPPRRWGAVSYNLLLLRLLEVGVSGFEDFGGEEGGEEFVKVVARGVLRNDRKHGVGAGDGAENER